MGVISGALYYASNVGLSAEASVLTGLTDRFVLVFCVTDFADGCAAGVVHHSHFTAGQSERNVRSFLCHHLGSGTGGPDHLATSTRMELDVVHERTEGDQAERKRVARQNVGSIAALHSLAYAKILRRKDVSLLAIHVVEQRDSAGSVRIVFDRRDLGLDTVFVSLEVDDSIAGLVTTASVERGDATSAISTARLGLGSQERALWLALGDLTVRRRDHMASARRCWV